MESGLQFSMNSFFHRQIVAIFMNKKAIDSSTHHGVEVLGRHQIVDTVDFEFRIIEQLNYTYRFINIKSYYNISFVLRNV